MVTITLDDRDEAILQRLREGVADVESLAEDVDCSPAYLRQRLPQLADNGLVRGIDGETYGLTENGERAIVASPAGAMDDRIDTPEEVERLLESFDLRTDRAAAVRAAFSFLRYWGDATPGEIVDAVYSEHPAGFDASETWWTELVRDRLEGLPRVDPPVSGDRYWRYAGTPVVEKDTDDGRHSTVDGRNSPGSARHALEHLELTAGQRSAVRAAFDHLVREGEASATTLRSRIYPDEEAGYESADEWWTDCIGPAFGALQGVEPADGSPDRWRYRHSAEGSMSSDPGARLPDDLLGERDADDE